MVEASESLILFSSCTFSLCSQFSTSLFSRMVILLPQVVTLWLIPSHAVVRSVECMSSRGNLEVFVKILALLSFKLTAWLQTMLASADFTLDSSFCKFLFLVDLVFVLKSLEGHTTEASHEV